MFYRVFLHAQSCLQQLKGETDMRKPCMFGIRKFKLLVPPAVLLLLLLASFPAKAQTTGTIYGSVRDPNGAAIPGGTVTVRSLATNQTRTTPVNEGGNYTLPLLPAGKYSVSVEAAGFSKITKELDLEVNSNQRVDFDLTIGEVTTQVVVTDAPSQVDTASVTLGKVVEERRIVELPLNGRNFLQLGTLQAGVAPPVPGIDVVASGTNETPGGTKFNFSVNGMRITSNNHLLDGVNNVDPITGSAMIVPSPDMLQEFRILTNMYTAEYGRAGGSIVTVLTKRGSNNLNGSAFEFLRNDKLDARNFFAPEVPPLKQNQFGFTLGGPIIKNRTFFFGGYEGFRQRKGIPVNAVVPSLRVRQGDFSQEAIKPRIPFSQNFFPGNQVPVNPISRALLALYPEPNQGANIWSATPVGSNDRNQFMVRVDHSINENNTLVGRYLFDKGTRVVPVGHFASNAAPNIQVPGFTNADENRFQNLAIGNTHVFSPTVVNDFRFSYQRATVATGKPLGQVDRSALGFTFPLATSIEMPPIMGISGITGLGPPSFSQRDYDVLQFTDDLAWSRRNHNLKFGAELRSTRVQSLYTSLGQGAYTFNGLATGNAQADFVLGAPFLFLQAGGREDKELKQTAYYFYVQDDFRVTPRLTLTLGLRYELAPGFTESENLILTFEPGLRSQIGPTLPAGLVRAGDPGIPRTVFETDKNNFAPRVGIAWDPFGDGKTSVRAGYGIFYDESSLLQTLTVQQPPDVQPIQVLVFPQSFADPFRGNSPFANPTPPFPVGAGTTATFVSRDLRPGYIQHWNFTIQRQLTSAMALEVAYVGNKGTRLQGNVNFNQPFLTANATAQNIAQRRPMPQFSNLFGVVSAFNSGYHGLQTTLTHRFSRGLSFQAAYTWSKAVDDTTQPSAFFLIPGQNAGRAQDSRNLTAERGLSAFDIRHRFVMSYIYELPFLRSSKGLVYHMFGGWNLNGIIALQSGYPFTILDTFDPDTDQIPENGRPDVLRDPNLPSGQRTPERWFDTTAFQRMRPPNYGNSGRNILFADGVINFDLGLFKVFKIDEQRRFEFRWEIFNVFNHPNFGIPNNDLNSSTFGRVFRTSTPERQMQFGLKFLF
jgi:hypothetical protein